MRKIAIDLVKYFALKIVALTKFGMNYANLLFQQLNRQDRETNE